VTDSAGALPARVFLRPIGTPLTIGMSGLVIGSLVESGLELHWIGASQTHEVGLILIAAPFVLQLLGCVFSYLACDGAAGAALGALATSWLAIGLIHLLSKPGQTSGALGLMLAAAGGVLSLSAVAVCQAKRLPGLVFLLAALRFGLAAVYELSGASPWQNAGGIVGLVICAGGAYGVLAFELESARPPEVFSGTVPGPARRWPRARSAAARR
jgi:succinate-acetate transporter protein